MKFFDSHAHYYDERFVEECPAGVDTLIGALFNGSVSYIINVGTSPETSRLAIAQAQKYPNMYTTVGIHPSDTRFLSNPERELSEIRDMLLDKSSKAVAIGEIGLDYHYEGTDKKTQMLYLDRQMQMARELNLPVVIHDREAHEDIMAVVRKYPDVKGVFHSFSGSAEMARELVSLGYMISFSGTLTFTNARKPKEAAMVVPRDRLLIETDCPYLAPHPKRGTLNHSGNLEYTNRVLAEVLGVTEEECAVLTENNARRFFRL